MVRGSFGLKVADNTGAKEPLAVSEYSRRFHQKICKYG